MISGHASPAAIEATTVVFTVIAELAIVARLCTRVLVSKQAGLDDALITVAGAFLLGLCITTYLQAYYGMGLHVWDFGPDMFATITKYFWAAQWNYYAALCFCKLSILLQYLRIFPQINFRRACYFMIVITIIWGLWTTLSALFMCVPIPVFWEQVEFENPYCMNRLIVWYWNAGLNIASDTAIALLPIGVIRSLEIPNRQKNLLLAVFCMGLLTCVVSILRLAYIFPVSVSTDMTWQSPMICIVSVVEAAVAILCSCLPTLKGVIQRVWPKLLDSLASARGSRRDGSSGGVSNASATSSMRKLFKKKIDAQELESGSDIGVQVPEKSHSRLGFLKSPFSSLTRSGNCYGSTSDEEVMFDSNGAHSTRSKGVTGSTLLSNLSDEEKQIEVHTTVDLYQEFTEKAEEEMHPAVRELELDPKKHASRAESTKTLVSGPGTGVLRDPFAEQ